MSEKLEIPGVAEYAEKLEAAKDNTKMKAHRICGTCYPGDVPIGTPALCGVKVLGLPASKNECDDCERQAFKHVVQHLTMGRG